MLEHTSNPTSPPQVSVWPFFGILGVLALISAYSGGRKTPIGANSPLSLPNQTTTKRKKKGWYARWRTLVLLVNVATLAAVIVYAYLTKRIYDTAQRQLAATERPWIKPQIVPTSDLTFDEKDNAHLTVVVATKNVGHSVATGITTAIALISADNYFQGPIERQRRICEEVTKRPLEKGNGYVLFPGDDGSSPANGLSTPNDEIEKSRLPLDNKPGRNAMFFIVGCVDYGYSGLPAHHQTGFVYDVFCLNPKEPNHPSAIEIGKTWSTQSLIIAPHGFSGGYAD